MSGGEPLSVARAALAALEASRARIDDLNVYPVPDGDTGTNMTETVRAVVSALERDDELATLFLFEGRRIRGNEGRVKLSSGWLEFSDVIVRLIKRGQKDGSFDGTFDAGAVAAALIGGTEAMVRERMLARQQGANRTFSDRQVQRIFAAMLDGFAPR